MPSGSRITFREAAAADIPTPDSGQVSLFVDSADSEPKYRDDGGTLHTLQGEDGELTYTDHGNTGASEDIVASTNVHRIVLNAATVTLTTSAWPASGTPGIVRLLVVQDGTGGRLISWPGAVTWGSAGAPTLQTGAGAIDIIDLQSYDGGTTILGSYEVTGVSASLVTAKGDIIAATGSGAVDNLPVGANDTILMADSAQANGLKWVASATPTTQDYDDVAAAGTADTFARGDHLHGMPSAGGGGASVATIDAELGANVTMTTANTFYDGPSGSFAAGTWLIVYKALFETAGTVTHQYVVKLWDGSTVYDSAQNDCATTANGHGIEVSGCAIVTLGSTTTLKISGADVRNSQTMLRNPNANSPGTNDATRLVGYKVT